MSFKTGLWVMFAGVLTGCSSFTIGEEQTVTSLYDIEVVGIDGSRTVLREYEGRVILIVNTASRCGFTKQYEALQRIYDTYKERGFVVLGFPSNDFLGQEPGTDEEILEFCQTSFGVEFPMFSKVVVKAGHHQHALYRFLTDKSLHPEHGGRITWNFNKFLIARDGRIADRFGSRQTPESETVVAAIKAALDQPHGSTPGSE